MGELIMKKSRKIGLLFSVIHLMLVVFFVYYLKYISAKDGQGQLMWAYWLIIDFPISLLVLLSFLLNVTSHYMLYFVHGVLGTICWFYWPVIISNLYAKWKKRKE